MRQILLLILFGQIVWISGGSSGSGSSDPCAGTTCGKGAQCRTVSNLVVCICPDDSVGDPFVECRSLNGPSSDTQPPPPPTVAATTSLPDQPSNSPAAVETHLSTPDLKLEAEKANETTESSNPTFSVSNSNAKNPPLTQQKADGEDGNTYFPSAPPTLSHYAHSHSFHHHLNSGPIQFNTGSAPTEPPSQYHQQLNQLYSGSRTRTRPQSHPNNIGNHESSGGGYGQQATYHGPIPHPHPHPYPHPNADFDLHQNQNQHPLYRNSEHRHHFPTHHHPHPHGNGFHTPPQHHYQQSQSFNLKPESHSIPHGHKTHHDSPPAGGMEMKDPLGKYENCRTINNIIVCADTSSDTEVHHRRIHPHPHAISEHRYPANSHGPPFNTFHHNDNKPIHLPPPPFGPPHHNNNNFNENKHSHPSPQHLHGGSGNGNNYHQPPASKTDYEHYQHSSRPGPITTDESSYGHRPSSAGILPPTPPTHQNSPHKHDHPHFGMNNENSNKPVEPLPGSNDFALCKKLCGEGSICRVLMGRPICGCPEGHTGDPAVKCYIEKNTKYDPNACQRHTDCSLSMVCLKAQCTDPCLLKNREETPNISSFHYSLDSVGNNGSICGVNAVCTVVEHTPLCSCEQNYFGNPYVGCVV